MSSFCNSLTPAGSTGPLKTTHLCFFVTMNTWLVVAVLTIVAVSHADDQYLEYDAVAIKRFEDELRRLGVSPPAVTVPDPPVTKPVPPPKVSSPAGDFVGYWTKSQFKRPIAAFEGIPYAQPPVGPLRFKLAQPLPRFPSPFNATKQGSGCMQEAGGLEDCLFMNIYVPEKVERSEKERLPVAFDVHGGGFIGGWAWTQPGMILEKDVVLVSFNYRLGPLGFLTTEDGVIPANLGMKDQVAALRWVEKNIASFGGNPNLVTVTGISAGGASTEFLMLSPLTKGLMHRAMPMSGSAYCPWALSPPGEMRQNVRKAAEFIKCPAEPSSELLACLQTKSGAEITQLNRRFAAWRQDLVVPFRIVVEGNVPGALLPEHPSKMFANRSNDVPVFTGIVSEEGGSSGMFGLFNSPAEIKKFDEEFVSVVPPMINLAGPKETSKATVETLKRAYFGPGPLNRSHALFGSKLAGDVNFFRPVVRSVQSHRKGAKSPVYFYYFNFRSSRNLDRLGEARDFGVTHGYDGTYLSPMPDAANPMDVRMALVYSDLFTSFVQNGVPTTTLVNVTWTPVSSPEKDMEYLYIYTPIDIKVKKNLFAERWSLLRALFD